MEDVTVTKNLKYHTIMNYIILSGTEREACAERGGLVAQHLGCVLGMKRGLTLNLVKVLILKRRRSGTQLSHPA